MNLEVRYYKGERIPWKPHDCTESNTCTFCRREKRRFISALNSHKAQTPMHTPPDKCPKCGAPLEKDVQDIPTYSCGVQILTCQDGESILCPSALCLMTQRAQKAEERAEKWKKVAGEFMDWFRACKECRDTPPVCKTMEAYDKLLSEEQ